MNIIDLTQRTPAWHRWRAQGITASEIAVIAGQSPDKTPWRLWAEKTGLVLPEDLSRNPNVQRGIRLEPAARLAFEQQHNTLLLPLCAEADDNPLLRASFDGINDDGEPVELKCPCTSVFEDLQTHGTDSPTYQLHRTQVLYQIRVAGSQRGWLVFYHNDEVLIFIVTRDEEMLQQLELAAISFWHRVQRLQAPEKDPTRDLYIPTQAQRADWQELVSRYRSLKTCADGWDNQLKQAKSELTAIQKRLCRMMGDYAHTEFGGIKLTRYLANGQINYGQLIDDQLPALDDTVLDQYRKPAQERVRVSLRDAGPTGVQFPSNPLSQTNTTTQTNPTDPTALPDSFYF